LYRAVHSASLSTPLTTPAPQSAAEGEIERAIGIGALLVLAALFGWWLAA
jgi:hypothetical protein